MPVLRLATILLNEARFHLVLIYDLVPRGDLASEVTADIHVVILSGLLVMDWIDQNGMGQLLRHDYLLVWGIPDNTHSAMARD